MRQEILDRIAPLLPPDQRDATLAMLDVGLLHLEAHGDMEALPRLREQVEAFALAVEAGDVEAAASLAAEWGVTAEMFSQMAG